MMNMDVYTAHNLLLAMFKAMGNPEAYIRAQTISNIGMDKVDKESIDGLLADGEKMYEDNKE